MSASLFGEPSPGFWRGVTAGVLGAAVAWNLFAHRCLVFPPSDTCDVRLGDPEYRVRRISSPSASGLALRMLAGLLCRRASLFGQLVFRMLLNDNRFERLRSLADQVIQRPGSRALEYPVVRLSLEEHAAHERLAEEAAEVRHRRGPYYSVLDYAEAYKTRRSSPVDVLDRVLLALEALPAELCVFRTLSDRSELLNAALASSARHAEGRPLSNFDGVPVAVKDSVKIAGLSSTFGTHPSMGSGPAERDDVLVARLRATGALILGLTVMTEFGSTPLGYNVQSRGPVNPYDLGRYCGGSSSGSALGAALGLFPVALGFDGGGSIRIPAAMQGVVGLKCTWGRVPYEEDYFFATTGGGPIAGCAADLALFYKIIGRPEPGHFFSKLYGPTPMPPPHAHGFDAEDLQGLRVGVYQEWIEDCHPEVRARSLEALALLQAKGAEVVQVNIPNLEVLALAHAVSISVDFALEHEKQRFEHPETLEPATFIQMGVGECMSACELAAAGWVRGYAMDVVADLFKDQSLDVIFTPTIGVLPPKMPASARSTGESNSTLVVQLLQFIFLGNLCGLPCISMPAGLSQQGLPIGVHCMAKHWDEHVCLRVANALDIPQYRTKPPNWVDVLQTCA